MYRRAVLFAGIGDGEIATETEKRASDGLMKLETFLSEPGSADFVVKRTMARRLCASLNRARQTRPIFTLREGCPLAGLTRPFSGPGEQPGGQDRSPGIVSALGAERAARPIGLAMI